MCSQTVTSSMPTPPCACIWRCLVLLRCLRRGACPALLHMLVWSRPPSRKPTSLLLTRPSGRVIPGMPSSNPGLVSRSHAGDGAWSEHACAWFRQLCPVKPAAVTHSLWLSALGRSVLLSGPPTVTSFTKVGGSAMVFSSVRPEPAQPFQTVRKVAEQHATQVDQRTFQCRSYEMPCPEQFGVLSEVSYAGCRAQVSCVEQSHVTLLFEQSDEIVLPRMGALRQDRLECDHVSVNAPLADFWYPTWNRDTRHKATYAGATPCRFCSAHDLPVGMAACYPRPLSSQVYWSLRLAQQRLASFAFRVSDGPGC